MGIIEDDLRKSEKLMLGLKIKLNNKLLVWIMIVTSSMFVLKIGDYMFFLWLQIIFVFSMIFFSGKVVLLREFWINFIYVSFFISAFSAFMTDMPESYKKTAIVLPIMLIPLYFTTVFLKQLIGNDHTWLEIIKNALKIAIIIQLIWIPLQIGFYYVLHIDINNLLFVETFHMVENATFIRSWIWHPSGLSWHSAVLAPLFVLGIILFDNIYIRAIIIVESMLIGNTTTVVGVALGCGLLMIDSVMKTNCYKKIKRKTIITVIIFGLLFLVAVVKLGIGEIVLKELSELWVRLFGEERDASTAAHLGYYSDYIKIVKRSSLVQILIGYGYGCSGYQITTLYNRYVNLGNWSIESDIVDILVSRGILGFIGHYYFLFYIMLKGLKLDYRYFVLLFTIFVQGFGYNVQFDYVFFIEMILFLTIKMKINFFDVHKSIS